MPPAAPAKATAKPLPTPGRPAKVGPKQAPAEHFVTGLEGKWTDQDGHVYIFGPGNRVEWHVPLPAEKGTAIYTGIYTKVQNRLVVVPQQVKGTNSHEDSKLKESLKNHRAGSYIVAKQPDGSMYLAGPGGVLKLRRS